MLIGEFLTRRFAFLHKKTMARNRMLNPDFWFDEEICSLSFEARLLYMGLWGICDDNYATFPNKPKWVKAQVFPYDNMDTQPLLTELSNIKKIIPFEENCKKYYWIKNFFKHQYINRPSKAKYPPYPNTLSEYSVRAPAEKKGKEIEKKGNENNNLDKLKNELLKKKIIKH